MIIFYTASYFGKKKYQREYDLVATTLQKFEIDLIGTEVGNYQDLLSERAKASLGDNPKRLHYEAVRQGVRQADAVVIECSQEDFQIGHEATLAMEERKPVLCLSVHEDLSERVFGEYLFGSQYTEMSLEGIIQDFLSNARELSLTTRFNMFLYPHQREYLQLASKKQGVNMSEYVRKLINRDKRMD